MLVYSDRELVARYISDDLRARTHSPGHREFSYFRTEAFPDSGSDKCQVGLI